MSVRVKARTHVVIGRKVAIRKAHKHLHKPIKWASAGCFVIGTSLEHAKEALHFAPLLMAGAAALFLVMHVVTWVLAD